MDAARLRTATETEHRTLEAELNLLRPSFTREEYADLLKHFRAFYSVWEQEVEKAMEAALPGFLGPRRKLDLLEADLVALDEPPECWPLQHRLLTLPRVDNTARALGSMYVTEGSTLGGQLLSRHFRRQLGVECHSGCSFFSGYGARTAEMWREFRNVLAGRPSSEDEDILESALDTFRTFRALFQWSAR